MNARAAFSYGGSTGASARRLDAGGRKKEGKGREGEEGGCSATRIFTRKGVSVIYWKSLPRSCGFVASPGANLTCHREGRALRAQKLNLFAKASARAIRDQLILLYTSPT